MNRIKWIFVFIFPAIFFPACQSIKTIQNQMKDIQSELFYELTTPVYSENINNTIYLNPINNSTFFPYTTVKRTGRKVLPFIFYNLVQNKYEVTLGDASLIQPYNEFLIDALLAQCNRSSCFHLKVNDKLVLPDSALILEVKVNKSITTAKMINNAGAYIIPIDPDMIISFENWEVNQPVSWLEISACLKQQDNCLWEKTYIVTQDLPNKQKGIERPFFAYEACIDYMTECLSYTTKGIIESISQNLHLLMLQKNQINNCTEKKY